MTASKSAPATILHLTQAERAIAKRDRTAIQSSEERIRLPAIHRLLHVQLAPARLACMTNKMMPGIHVTWESSTASTDDFPNTYSVREKGRQKKSGSAPFARSGDTSPGPTNAVRRNARAPCTLMYRKKNLL